MIRFYMDENVSGAVTKGLRQRGIDVLTVQEENREGRPDPEVLDRATELERVLFTQDDDLLREAAKRQAEELSFVGVIYVHQSKLTTQEAIANLELIAQAGEPTDFANRVEYLPL